MRGDYHGKLRRQDTHPNLREDDIVQGDAMKTLRVKLLAYKGAEQKVFDEGKVKLSKLLRAEYVEFVDTRPNVLFFLSGGSEHPAIEVLEQDRFYTLLAYKEGNSYAAATEVKAYANQHGFRSTLLDIDAPQTQAFMTRFLEASAGLRRLRGQKLGLIGDVSEWLIASPLDSELLREKFRIELTHIPWDRLPGYQSQSVSEKFLDTFHSDTFDLRDSGKVYTLLKECIRKRALNAIAVECFSLVTKHAVTACLPLGQFNADGLPAGCEGDVLSTVGMMLAKETTGMIPWLVNTVQISEKCSSFAHCTIAPTFIDDCTITTHFETGKGTAIQGTFRADDVTLFRLNRTLDRGFLTTGTVLNRPRNGMACRTQIELRLSPESVKALRDDPLGNHHLILPGDHTAMLSLIFRILGIENTVASTL